MLDKISRYWFIGSTIVIAILFYMYNRRGQQLQEAIFNLQRKVLEDKLEALKEKAENDKANYNKYLGEYRDLKSKYAADLERLGARMPDMPERPKPNLRVT